MKKILTVEEALERIEDLKKIPPEYRYEILNKVSNKRTKMILPIFERAFRNAMIKVKGKN